MLNDKTKLLFASKNNDKLIEIKNIFTNSNYDILSLNGIENIPDVIEDGLTFEDNAKKKAKEIYKLFSVNTIADDSGLSVEQLDGKPGIFSSRYSGEDSNSEKNIDKLLNELKMFSIPHKAKFICNAVFYDGKKYLTATGELEGEIIYTPKGKNGFGYDPIFIPNGFDKTLAELSSTEKNRISHRAKAFVKLITMLKNNVH